MIRSMTACGSARAESTHGSVTVEFRSVNSRYLDINFRLPEDLRMAEGPSREQLALAVKRGKIENRLNYARIQAENAPTLVENYLALERSGTRRVGTERVSTGRSRGTAVH